MSRRIRCGAGVPLDALAPGDRVVVEEFQRFLIMQKAEVFIYVVMGEDEPMPGPQWICGVYETEELAIAAAKRWHLNTHCTYHVRKYLQNSGEWQRVYQMNGASNE